MHVNIAEVKDKTTPRIWDDINLRRIRAPQVQRQYPPNRGTQTVRICILMTCEDFAGVRRGAYKRSIDHTGAMDSQDRPACLLAPGTQRSGCNFVSNDLRDSNVKSICESNHAVDVHVVVCPDDNRCA
ncbi:MAG: hypothetical protein CMJ48_00265 [Planctomycetaceae bacterium]|nr:hypothetical protein [Planctomycetaceae bacterium]